MQLQVRTARSWAIFCMGVWLTGTVAMAVVATENFFTIDRLLQAKPNPVFAADVEKLGHDAARLKLDQGNRIVVVNLLQSFVNFASRLTDRELVPSKRQLLIDAAQAVISRLGS